MRFLQIIEQVIDFFKRKKEIWEQTCKRCGLCCYEKDKHSSIVTINLQKPCPYLDTQKKICTIYENRFKICKQCQRMTIFHALFSGYLPQTCGYVEKYRKWHFIANPQIKT